MHYYALLYFYFDIIMLICFIAPPPLPPTGFLQPATGGGPTGWSYAPPDPQPPTGGLVRGQGEGSKIGFQLSGPQPSSLFASPGRLALILLTCKHGLWTKLGLWTLDGLNFGSTLAAPFLGFGHLQASSKMTDRSPPRKQHSWA